MLNLLDLQSLGGQLLCLLLKRRIHQHVYALDYWASNKVIIRDKYLLFRLDEIFGQIKGAIYFTKIDLTSRYQQVRIKEADFCFDHLMTKGWPL